MNIQDIRVDLEALKREKQKDFQERLWFISYWVNKLQGMSDKQWTEIQAHFIDAQFKC